MTTTVAVDSVSLVPYFVITGTWTVSPLRAPAGLVTSTAPVSSSTETSQPSGASQPSFSRYVVPSGRSLAAFDSVTDSPGVTVAES